MSERDSDWLWELGAPSSVPSIDVIEPSDEPAKPGVPFGFARALPKPKKKAKNKATKKAKKK